MSVDGPGAEGIAIVGMGAIFPGAIDLGAYWHNLIHGVDAITDVPPGRLDPVFFDPTSSALDRFKCRRGGFVDGLATFDPLAFGMMPASIAAAEPDQLIALTTAAAAIADAGGLGSHIDRSRVGVVIGRGGYLSAGLGRLDQRVRMAEQLVMSLRQLIPGIGEDELDAVREEFGRQLGPYCADDAIGLVPNLVASRIANRLDLSGPAYTVDAACASSLIAVDHAMRILRSGDCDVVIAGGVHHCHDLTLWGVFSHLGALSTSGQSRPLARDADGLLIGEGTGLMVLKRLDDAEAQDDRVYAVIRGVGVSSDGRDSTVMRPLVAGQVLALRRAWHAARLEPCTVGLLEAHGTATPTGDAAELDTLAEVFGPGTSAGGGGGLGLLPIGSVKSMIGHAMPAAGAAGLIKIALALHHKTLPPTLNCEEAHPAMAMTRFRPIGEARAWEGGRQARRAGVNSFGFGGINAHAVLEEHRPTGQRRSGGWHSSVTVRPPAERIVLSAADDLDSLLSQLDEGSGSPERQGRLRLAVLGPTPERLALARKVAAAGRPWRGARDIWFTPKPLLADGGQLAFMFPGIEAAPPVQAADVATRFELAPLPPVDATQLGQHGMAVFALGRLLDDALGGLGIRPDVVAGHSIGEWNAMVSSGMVDAHTADPYLAKLDPAAIGIPELAYVAAGCSLAIAKRSVEGIDGVVVSHDNCPHQAILCGTEWAIAQAVARLREEQVIVSELPFRSGFHTPMFGPRLRQAVDALSVLPLGRPSLPLWSATTCSPYPDGPEEVRALAARHLTDPVRFRELTLNLYGQGVRAFVQVGVGSLVAFVDDTLRDHDHMAVSAAAPNADGLEQLCRVAAALWVEGAPLCWDRLTSGPGGAHPLTAAAGGPGQTGPSQTGPGQTGPSQTGPSQVRPAQAQLAQAQLAQAQLAQAQLAQAQLAQAQLAQAQLAQVRPAQVRPSQSRSVSLSTPLVSLSALPPLATVPRQPVAPRAPATAQARVAAPAAARAEGLAPTAAPILAAEEPRRHETITRSVSVEEYPWLEDHCLVRQRNRWPSASDRFPVVPLTTMIRWLTERGAAAAPDRVVTSLRGIRASRWLAAAPAADIVLTAVRQSTDTVQVAIEGYSRATVSLGDGYLPAPIHPFGPLPGEEPSVVGSDELYASRWMFHGPRFQAVRAIHGICEAGVRGRLEALEAPGSLLDGAGQLVGYWVMARTAADRIVLPAGVERIELYGPEPAVGTSVDCTVRINGVDDRSVRADMDLGVAGRLWARVVGWTEHRFETDDALWDVLRFPEYFGISEPRPGGWVLTPERMRRKASRDLVMRQYLGGAEHDQYQALNPLAERQWLLGRMAAKDAVRHWLWGQGAGPLFPAEVEVGNGPHGEPFVRGSFDADLQVSLAHTRGLAVAIVSEASPVGIDIEAVAHRDGQFDKLALTRAERELVPDADRDRWVTRFWVAKEAVAKAARTGLNGNPKAFEVLDIDGVALQVGDLWVDTGTVDDQEGNELVVGWTRLPAN